MSQSTFEFAGLMQYPSLKSLLNAHGVTTYYYNESGLVGFRWLDEYQWYTWDDYKGYVHSSSTKTIKNQNVSKNKVSQ